MRSCCAGRVRPRSGEDAGGEGARRTETDIASPCVRNAIPGASKTHRNFIRMPAYARLKVTLSPVSLFHAEGSRGRPSGIGPDGPRDEVGGDADPGALSCSHPEPGALQGPKDSRECPCVGWVSAGSPRAHRELDGARLADDDEAGLDELARKRRDRGADPIRDDTSGSVGAARCER